MHGTVGRGWARGCSDGSRGSFNGTRMGPKGPEGAADGAAPPAHPKRTPSAPPAILYKAANRPQLRCKYFPRFYTFSISLLYSLLSTLFSTLLFSSPSHLFAFCASFSLGSTRERYTFLVLRGTIIICYLTQFSNRHLWRQPLSCADAIRSCARIAPCNYL